MIKQVQLADRVNPYFYINQPNNQILLQYDTKTQTLKLVDLYNKNETQIINGGGSTPSQETSGLIEELSEKIQAVSGKLDELSIGVFKFQGSCSEAELQTKEKIDGHVWQVEDKEYACNGTEWVELGFNIDISNLAEKADTLSGYGITDAYTKSEADQKFLTEHQDISNLALSSDVRAEFDSLTIPTKTSQLTNDSGFLTEHQDISNLAEKATTLSGYNITDAYTKNESDVVFNVVVDVLMSYINQLQDQIISLKQTDVVKYNTIDTINDSTKDAVISVSTTIISPVQGGSTTNITAKSVQVKELNVDSVRLNIAATGDVNISNFKSEGNLAKTTSNASTSINTSGYVTIKDSTIGQSGYNCIEIGLNNSSNIAGVTIDNIHFTGKFSNNVILIFETDDNAVINISNCIFDECDNPLRISNRKNGKVTVNLVNCEFTKWSNTPAYMGAIICEDYSSGNSAAEAANNLFAPDKVKINIINCTHNGQKIVAPQNMADICGSQNENQILYVYYDKTGSIPYDVNKYPELTIK